MLAAQTVNSASILNAQQKLSLARSEGPAIGRPTATVAERPGEIELRVEDEGPGIPEGRLEEVLKPFRRLETSRNRESGGAGLGLAIANAVALAHGGLLTLWNRAREG